MSGRAHRANGLCGAACAHAESAEILPSLIHVEAGAILAARRAIPKLHGVTGAPVGAVMPDGRHRPGARDIVKADGAMRLADGTPEGHLLELTEAPNLCPDMRIRASGGSVVAEEGLEPPTRGL